MKKRFQIGDIVSVCDISEGYDFKVTKVTDKEAVAEQQPQQFVGKTIEPYLAPIRMHREYEQNQIAPNWSVWNVKFIPDTSRWLKVCVKPANE